jgi:hypothetical protein
VGCSSFVDSNFEIIYITKAEHLDENREFIKEIYDLVKAKDNRKISIFEGEYLRVVFERELDSSKDITIYAESNDSSIVEVYEKNGGRVLGEFNIKNFQEYKIFLDGLKGTQDTFDLKVVSGIVL